MTDDQGYRLVTPTPPDEAPRIDELIWRRAAEQPQAPAVLDGSSTMTYAELAGSAGELAGRLRAAGVRRGDPVAVLLDRSADFVVTVAAVLRAGGACLLLSPADPVSRTAALLAAVRPAIAVAHPAHSPVLTESGLHVVHPAASSASGVADAPPVGGDATDLAFVMSTSGSTGVPKAVRISHANYTSQLGWIRRNLGLTSDDRVLVKAPTSFVSMLRQLVWPLAVGATLVLVPPGGEFEAPVLSRLIDEHRVTFVTFISPALGSFLHHARLDGGSVRNVVTGGDRFPHGMARAFFEVFPGARLHHTYGMTETILVSCALLTGPDADELGMGPTLPGSVAFVLDSRHRRVAPGEVGDLFVGGVGLTSGYVGRPDLDRERLIELPHLAPGRYFDTRDRARLRPDGSFELVGRSDSMVKVRGFRVELGEVECALRDCPGITHAVCRADSDATGDSRITAFVQSDPTVRQTDATLRQLLRERVPDYMVPARFIQLAAIPLTANGKVDRDRLPDVPPLAVPAGVTAAEQRDAEPADSVAAAVRAAWSEVLNASRPTLDDDFYAAGGTSFTAMDLTARLSDELGVDIPVTTVLDHPTLDGLIRAVAAQSRPARAVSP